MSSLFNHVFIPLALLLLFSEKLKLHRRNIFLFAAFGILPDADISMYHRAMLHNIFVLLIPLLLFVFWRGRREITGIICFYLASHILLDIFNGGAYVLYPFYEGSFYVNAEILFRNNMFLPLLKYGISPTIINNGSGEPVISSENIAVALAIFFGGVISILKKSR